MLRKLAVLCACTLLWGCGPGNVRETPLDSVTVPQGDHVVRETTEITGVAPIQKMLMDHCMPMKLAMDLGNGKSRQVKTYRCKYDGKPPKGVFNAGEVKNLYRFSKYEVNELGVTVVYETDLGMMSMRFEHATKKTRYETATVPYGFCLDYIDQNLGKQNEGGWHLTKIECTQSGLGKDY